MNIMDVLTPKPSFDPKKKNEAVKFVPKQDIHSIHFVGKVITGINRTKDSFSL